MCDWCGIWRNIISYLDIKTGSGKTKYQWSTSILDGLAQSHHVVLVFFFNVQKAIDDIHKKKNGHIHQNLSNTPNL